MFRLKVALTSFFPAATSNFNTNSKHRMITTYEDAYGLLATVLPDLRHGLDRRNQPANLIISLLASMGEMGEGQREIETGDNHRQPVQLPPQTKLLLLRHQGNTAAQR